MKNKIKFLFLLYLLFAFFCSSTLFGGKRKNRNGTFTITNNKPQKRRKMNNSPVLKKNQDNEYQCLLCSYTNKYNTEVKYHIFMEHKYCYICKLYIVDKDEKQQHALGNHNTKINKKYKMHNEHRCPFCLQDFKTSSNHIIQKHIKLHKCPEKNCGWNTIGFPSFSRLMRHYTSKHMKCLYCQQKFPVSHLAWDHMDIQKCSKKDDYQKYYERAIYKRSDKIKQILQDYSEKQAKQKLEKFKNNLEQSKPSLENLFSKYKPQLPNHYISQQYKKVYYYENPVIVYSHTSKPKSPETKNSNFDIKSGINNVTLVT